MVSMRMRSDQSVVVVVSVVGVVSVGVGVCWGGVAQAVKGLRQRLCAFVQLHRAEFLAAYPDLSVAERRWLGLLEEAPGPAKGTIGRIAET